MNYQWKYNGELYENKRDIKDAFGFTTCVWNAKIKDGEIIKLNELNLVTANEDIYSDKQQDCAVA